jgi:hypothetical protein
MFHLLVEPFGRACYQSAVTFHNGDVSVTFDFTDQSFSNSSGIWVLLGR